jgi:hypothetical protein
MEEIWKEMEPFFRANGSYAFRAEKYAADIAETNAVCKCLGISVPYYLQGVFYPRLSEQFIEYKIRPRHLHSQWALIKFKDWLKLGTNVSPINMEIEFIRHTKEHVKTIGMTEKEYFSGGILLPPCIDDVVKRRVSIIYCSSRKPFKDMYARLPKDIKSEFFESIDVFYIATQTLLYKQIVSAINE